MAKSTFNFNVGLPANDQNEANRKMAALINISNHLSVDDVEKLAKLAADPAKVKMAKKFL